VPFSCLIISKIKVDAKDSGYQLAIFPMSAQKSLLCVSVSQFNMPSSSMFYKMDDKICNFTMKISLFNFSAKEITE
jgi:hypothetical protein